jgi:hypothetical protein
MKKILALLLVLSLGLGLLCGCGKLKEAGKMFGDVMDEASNMFGEVVDEVTKQTQIKKTGFTITMPAYTVDTSKSSTAVKDPYVLTAGTIAVYALEQPKEEFGKILSLKEYGQLLIDSNKFDAKLEEKDGLYTFTYADKENNLTFQCIALETDNAFWYISAACLTELLESNKETMWTYLTSAEVSATGPVYVPIPELTTTTVKKLTIAVPVDGFKDITEERNEGMTFIYQMGDEVMVMGLRQKKSSLEDVKTLDEYAQRLIAENKLEVELQYHDGIPYFTYPSPDGEFTYIATAHEGEKYYWFVQAYTFTQRFETLERILWTYLSSVTVE